MHSLAHSINLLKLKMFTPASVEMIAAYSINYSFQINETEKIRNNEIRHCDSKRKDICTYPTNHIVLGAVYYLFTPHPTYSPARPNNNKKKIARFNIISTEKWIHSQFTNDAFSLNL